MVDVNNKKSHFIEWIMIILIVVSLAVGFVAGYFIVPRNIVNNSEGSELIDEAYSIIDERWYNADGDEVNILDGTIAGMVETLQDPHTSYLSAKEAEEFNNDVEGSYEGIGVSFQMVQSGALIVNVFDHTPAALAGLVAGEIITAVGETSLSGKTSDEVVELVRGPRDSTVTLTIFNAGNTYEETLQRGSLDISVSAQIKEVEGIRYGYIEITTFGSNTSEEVENALKDFQSNGVATLVIDVRDNGGGYLNAAKDIMNLFVEEGEPIYQLQEKTGPAKVTTASGGSKYSFPHSYILINENSASASELVAGSLSEMADFTLIGSTTYGKGTAQTQQTLSNGSVIKYTYASWLTANGNTIEGSGLAPDIEVENMRDDSFVIEQFDAPYQYDSVGNAVSSMQKMLQFLGYDVDRTDGYFTTKTEEALKAFEKSAYLVEDGIYTMEDQEYLFAYFVVATYQPSNDLQYHALESEIIKDSK